MLDPERPIREADIERGRRRADSVEKVRVSTQSNFFSAVGAVFRRGRGGPHNPLLSAEIVLSRSAAAISVNRRCRWYFGRFATTLDLRLFQQNRPIADNTRCHTIKTVARKESRGVGPAVSGRGGGVMFRFFALQFAPFRRVRLSSRLALHCSVSCCILQILASERARWNLAKVTSLWLTAQCDQSGLCLAIPVSSNVLRNHENCCGPVCRNSRYRRRQTYLRYCR